MAVNKKSFLLYTDVYFTVEKLTDEQAGRLFKIILEYVNDRNPGVEDKLIEIAFEPIKQALKRDLRRYEEIRVKRSNTGYLGGIRSGEVRKQKQANEANASKVKQTKQKQANEAVNDNVNVNVIVNDIDIEQKKNKEELLVFDEFRKLFPGIKRGNDVEFDNFIRHKDWRDVLPKLQERLNYQIASRTIRADSNLFVPSWKNLKTWINQRCWEDIINTEE